MDIIECQICGFQDPLGVEIDFCGQRVTTCQGCHTLTSRYKVVSIEGEPYQPIKKMRGFTLEEIQSLTTEPLRYFDFTRIDTITEDERGYLIEKESPEIHPVDKMVIAKVPNNTHPYTVFFRCKNGLYNINIIYPDLESIWRHYRILGYMEKISP